MDNKSNRQYTIDDLPDEILALIFDDLPFEKRAQCKLLCLRFQWIIENLTKSTKSLFITTNSNRSIDYHPNRLCDKHKLKDTNYSLIINPMDRIEIFQFILYDNQMLFKLRALKIDLDSQLELNTLKWSKLLHLLVNCRSLEHLELRAFTKQELNYLTIVNDLLIKYNQCIEHLSLKKIQYIDFLYLKDLNFFQQLFTKLNLKVFECDFCFQNTTPFKLDSQSLNRKQLTKLYLPNANSITIDSNENELKYIKSIGLGFVDDHLLNQLLDFKFLNHLEIKIREELNGEFITNRTIEQLTIHSLDKRLNVESLISACKVLKRLSLINCLFNERTVEKLIFNNLNSLNSIHLINDYWDDDRQIDYLISECFNRFPKLTEGYFKNILLNNFYKFIYLLAIKNVRTFYTLYLDYLPSNYEFDCNESNVVNNQSFPDNLRICITNKDYNY